MPPENLTMNGPAKNRLHEYEAGWLTLLLAMKVAEKQELIDARNRVAQQAVSQMDERRKRLREAREQRRRREAD
jgi:hypothetical protein